MQLNYPLLCGRKIPAHKNLMISFQEKHFIKCMETTVFTTDSCNDSREQHTHNLTPQAPERNWAVVFQLSSSRELSRPSRTKKISPCQNLKKKNYLFISIDSKEKYFFFPTVFHTTFGHFLTMSFPPPLGLHNNSGKIRPFKLIIFTSSPENLGTPTNKQTGVPLVGKCN